jgi:hypothetical protein
MEIERGVKLEYGGDLEGGLSAGPRNMERLPAFTDKELSDGLGELSDRIARAFRQPDDDDDTLAAGHA